MIDGIKIDIPSADLRAHLEARTAFHRAKAEWYKEHAESLRGGRVGQSDISNDPVSSLERSREHHGNKAVYFAVVLKYLIADTYRLSESDLARLEFTDAFYWDQM